MLPWRRAAGRICAEMICPNPPGIPVAAPGEHLTDETLEQFRVMAA